MGQKEKKNGIVFKKLFKFIMLLLFVVSSRSYPKGATPKVKNLGPNLNEPYSNDILGSKFRLVVENLLNFL